MHQQKTRSWKEKLLRSGYLFGAILIHLVVFLLVASVVIWRAPPPPPSDTFQPVSITPPAPPPPQPPASGAEANNPQLEPQFVVVPVVTPPSIISTTKSAFNMDVPHVLKQTLSRLSDQMAQGSGLASGAGGHEGAGSAFGSFSAKSNLPTGYFYDLKQTSDKKPTGMTAEKYLAMLADYVSKGWDDSIFDPYYKSKEPLCSSVFAISTRPSEDAPKAFGLEKEVQPGLWIIHYHSKVQSPSYGEFRFVGFADNVMVVKIKGETVLDAGWDSLTDKPNCRQLLPFQMPSYIPLKTDRGDPRLKIGPTFHMDALESVDLDILIGDCGGVCCFHLLLEKEGEPYETLSDGTPKLPYFQVDNKPAPTFSDQEEHPPFSATPEPWQPVED